MPTILKTGDDLDLRKIAESGQCFRWTPAGDNAWRILSAGECVRVTALGEGSFLFDCDETALALEDMRLAYQSSLQRQQEIENLTTWCSSRYE